MGIREGQLVLWMTNPDLGLAKVQSVNGKISRISYFVSLAQHRTFEVPADDLSPHDPWPQNRVYVHQDGTWRMGRLTELRQPGDDFLVRFPNGVERAVPESAVYVRSGGAVDPMEVLKLHGHETPFFFERRWPLVRHLTEQRAASGGVPALLSSAIDLRDHQVDVVRRVLHDPVQRYLLADEVGLGKTIEAGVVIRQLLIDQPGAVVTVLVPAHLIGQWNDELGRRFHLHDFPRATVHILPHSCDAVPRSDLLVIDEAHHLAAQAFSDGGSQRRYRKLAAAAHAAPRVLLLSATPASSDHRAYLGMLHLLDPRVYSLQDEAAFTARVQAQEAIGNAVFALQPDVPVMLLDTVFDDISRAVPQDRRVEALIASLRDEHCPDPPAAILALRVHLSETYRLHRRMLRHRRETHAEALVRGRQSGEPVTVTLAATAQAWEAFDVWREILAVTAGETRGAEAASTLAALWSAAAVGLPEWQAAVRDRQGQAGLHPDEQQALQVMLRRLEQIDVDAVEREVARAVVGAARQAQGKCVVFLSGGGAAVRLIPHLTALLGPGRAALAAQGAETIAWFREHQDALVLLVDQDGEEGLNLQCADVVIHLDLPLDARRVEQRIGRLDRYGRGAPIVSRVMSSPAWPAVVREHALLLDAQLKVHSTSIASLQTLLDPLLDEFLQAALQGPATQHALAAALPQRLEAELARVRQTELLDTIQFDASQVLQTQMDALYEVEAQGFNKSFTRWVHDVLNFKAHYDVDSLRFDFDRQRTLVNWERIADLHPVLNRPSTFSRRDAQRHGHNLLRFGEPFVDAMTRYLHWDDRGRSYAYWRADPRWDGDDTITFAFHFVVEGDLRAAEQLAQREHLDLASLRRRMDGLLGPMTWTIYLDQTGQQLPDSAQALLTPPYEGGREALDYNLSAQRVWALEELAPPGIWTAMCDRVLNVADTQLRADAHFVQAVEQARLRAQTTLDERLTILRSRQAAGQGDSSNHDLNVEQALAEALLRGIAAPTVTLDAVGAVVLSRRDPF